MKTPKARKTDELRPEYDLRSLQIRKVGLGRKAARRREIRENSEAGLKEFREGKLESFTSVDDLMNSLSDD